MGVTRVKLEGEKVEKPKVKKLEKKPIGKREVKVVVRVANTDLDGEKKLKNALLGIKGISHAMSKAICVAAGFDPNIKLGNLSEEEIARLESVIKNPTNYGIPAWLLNRRREPETGKDIHLVGTDIDIAKKFDIQRMMDMKTYKGIRHMYGLPVRGQRTRSSFRKGKVVGVMKRGSKTQEKKTGSG